MLRSEQRIQHNKSNYFSMRAADEFFCTLWLFPFVQCGQRHTPAPNSISEIPVPFAQFSNLKTWNHQSRGNSGRVSLKQNFNLIQKLLYISVKVVRSLPNYSFKLIPFILLSSEVY